ncbi:MAG: translation initiation factor IF-3 [Immundisolibacteraceae bacterium]|nr:translation initiation factor IF-3 [Immundisolibacteraceae bacterium]
MAKKDQTRINDLITVSEVRLIAADGGQLGVVSTSQAQELAMDAGMDLVEISPGAEPPVCKIMDFGKFLYTESKKKAAAKKNQKQVQVKEIKFRPRTDSGDYGVKLRNLEKFLLNGDRAKVTMRFRGREMAHQELGRNLLQRVEKDLEEIAVVEQFPRMEGRQMVMVLSPRK